MSCQVTCCGGADLTSILSSLETYRIYLLHSTCQPPTGMAMPPAFTQSSCQQGAPLSLLQ